MIRFLIYLVVGGVIYYALKGLFGGARRSGEEGQSDGVNDEMQKCPECGTYFPLHMGVSKRVRRIKLMFCGEECTARYARRGGPPAGGSVPPSGEE